jgi:hypothetical protein
LFGSSFGFGVITSETMVKENVMSGVITAVKKAIRSRELAYKRTFEGAIDQQIVLKDLARFCYAHKTTFHPDAKVQQHREGRREVWLRIQEQLNLSEDELFALFEKGNLK